MSKRLLVNAVSARAGGGLTDLVHTLPMLVGRLARENWVVEAYVSAAGYAALRDAGGCVADAVHIIEAGHPLRRAAWEFFQLPRIVHATRPAAVFQFSNFLFRRLDAPQLTVLRSQAYFSPDMPASQQRGAYLRQRYRLGRQISMRTIARADRVFCLSQTQRMQILASAGSVANKVRVTYPGVAVPEQVRQLSSCPRAALVKRLPEHQRIERSIEGRKVLLNVAHYYPQKNLGTLLSALDQLSHRRRDVVLVLTAGIGTDGGRHTPNTRREACLARDLEQRACLVDLGPVDGPLVWTLLAMADLFVFPSTVESFGHPLLEAMAMDVPVVAADTEIHREVCGDAAVFHAPLDAAALADAIDSTLDDQSQRNALIGAGRSNIERFSWEQHVNDLVEAILDMSGAHNTVQPWQP